MYVINLEDLNGLVCPSERSSRLGQSILFGIMSPFERSVGLVCPFRLTLWKKENFSFLVSGGACLGPDGVILDGLYAGLGRPKGLEFKKDTWREAPHTNYPRVIGFHGPHPSKVGFSGSLVPRY